jgi:hypothetical protein
MEMFGSIQPHLKGMLGTPRIEEWRRQLIHYIHRALIVSVFVARKLGLAEMEANNRELLEKFETEIGFKPDKTAAEMLSDMKKKTS